MQYPKRGDEGVAMAWPLNLDASVPSALDPWSHRLGPAARLRDRLGNALLRRGSNG